MKNLNCQKQFICNTLSVLILALLPLSSAYSADKPPPYVPAESSCDDDYYKSIKSRAWLEAQREITQNQNLILKPDSVFEYTCFNQMIDVVGETSGKVFSDNKQKWGSAAGDLKQSLNGMVKQPLAQYIAKNFKHNYLGKRAENITHGIPCEVMNKVWMEAKCMGFIDEEDTDGFYNFTNYRDSADKRQRPQACPKVDKWGDELKMAFDPKAENTWKRDPVKTFFDELDSSKCKDAKPFETGVIVYRTTEPKQYKEKVCVAPGCYYEPAKKQPASLDKGACVTK